MKSANLFIKIKKNLDAPDCFYEILTNPIFPTTKEYLKKLTTFRDLWRKGFYITSGAKFGCDYLIYEKPPDLEHSK